MNIITKIILWVLAVVLAIICYFFAGWAPKNDITWGVNFSPNAVQSLKLDWRKAYISVMDDLGAKNIKLITDWDWVEGSKDDYYFDDLDWEIKQAELRNVKLIYVIGIKSGRWPECHDPSWARQLSESQEQSELQEYITTVVNRYKGSKAIVAWQVENEPLFNFGECPWYDSNFLKKEVEVVKSLDSSRKVIISDSGEQSFWFGAAKTGDIVGTTMYRRVWAHIGDDVGFYLDSILPPVFYYRKALLIKTIFGKEVICVELQAEPWASKLFYDVPLSEQEKTMDLAQFKSNIAYAKKTGLKEFYLWGAEWWYWLKENQNEPGIWNEAKKLFN